MTDQTKPDLPVVEVIGTKGGQLSAMGSAAAPFVFFDQAACMGITADGVAHVTLVAKRHMVDANGAVQWDYVVTGHLRFGRNALASLKEAIKGIELMAQPPASAEKN